jgi:hypothetical protein
MKYDKSSTNKSLYDKILIITFFSVIFLANAYWLVNALFPMRSQNQPKHLGRQGFDFVVLAD